VIRIGTSGWTYDHWKGRFYPEDLTQKHWLEYYTTIFNTVELNATFYRIPKSSVAEGWFRRTAEDFRFAVKVTRLITHVHRMKNCEDRIEWFFRNLAPLSEKICAYLLQLPPSFIPDEDLLRDFTRLLPPAKYIFEFRNRDCYTKPLAGVLREFGAGFCIHDFPERESPLWVTSDTVYIRFHGYRHRYGGDYPENVLEEWAERIRGWSRKGLDVYGYFNNDAEGNAVKNAQMLKNLVEDI
jgi:uncharacterized protein YecE (DUF72 family)